MFLERTFIALGSNLNDPVFQIKCAIEKIDALDEVELMATSSLYKTKPLGPLQPDYVNAVIAVSCQLTPFELLKQLLEIEKQQGRVRGVKWGPRVLDCDILLFGNQIINNPELILPHPEMRKRGFVLVPMFEIVPDFIFTDGTPLQQLVTLFEPAECVPLKFENPIEV